MTNSKTKSETLPPGLYYIGDLMYPSLSEEEFEKSMHEIGVFTNEKGQKCAVFQTMAGDGVYRDNDGHSYTVDSGMKVRLSGIDTPERQQTCKKAGVTWRCGYEATETLKGWTYTKEVRCIGDTKDRYGRLIADCFVDGYNVNARLVYEGMALAYRKYSTKYVPEEDKARAAKRGMWVGEFVAPWNWRQGERFPEDNAVLAFKVQD